MYYVILEGDQTLSISKTKRSVVLFETISKDLAYSFQAAYRFAYPTSEDIDNVQSYDIIRSVDLLNNRAWQYIPGKQWIQVDQKTLEPIKEEKGITLSELCDLLQNFAHEGYAESNIEVCDEKGNKIFPKKVELKYSSGKAQITLKE